MKDLENMLKYLREENTEEVLAIVHQNLNYRFMQRILHLLEHYEITKNENCLNQARAITEAVIRNAREKEKIA
ncbi:MAG TPA: hypothetical protein ENO33_00450 [Hydrogenobaculum sp.]|nr:hypothetical protein [Hydrogenobaculum sp.]